MWRLASKLCKWDIEIMTREELEEQIARAVAHFGNLDGITDELAEVLVGEGFLSYDDLSVIEPDELAEMGGLSAEQVEAIILQAEEKAEEAEQAAAAEKMRQREMERQRELEGDRKPDVVAEVADATTPDVQAESTEDGADSTGQTEASADEPAPDDDRKSDLQPPTNGSASELARTPHEHDLHRED